MSEFGSISGCPVHPGYRCAHPKYFVIPRAYSQNWDDMLEFARVIYDVQGNDFIGSRTMRASCGSMVVKLWTISEDPDLYVW